MGVHAICQRAGYPARPLEKKTSDTGALEAGFTPTRSMQARPIAVFVQLIPTGTHAQTRRAQCWNEAAWIYDGLRVRIQKGRLETIAGKKEDGSGDA